MESGRGRRRGVLESEDLQPHLRPQMTGQARDEEEDEEGGGKKRRVDCGTESGRGRRPGGLETKKKFQLRYLYCRLTCVYGCDIWRGPPGVLL